MRLRCAPQLAPRWGARFAYGLPMRLRYALDVPTVCACCALEMRPPSRPVGAVGRALGAPPRPLCSRPGPRPLPRPLPPASRGAPFASAPAPSWAPLSAPASLARLLVAPCVLGAVRGRVPFAPSPVPPPRLFVAPLRSPFALRPSLQTPSPSPIPSLAPRGENRLLPFFSPAVCVTRSSRTNTLPAYAMVSLL